MTRDDGGVSELVRPRSQPLTTHSTLSTTYLPTSSYFLGARPRLTQSPISHYLIGRPRMSKITLLKTGWPSVGKLSRSWWRVEGHHHHCGKKGSTRRDAPSPPASSSSPSTPPSPSCQLLLLLLPRTQHEKLN